MATPGGLYQYWRQGQTSGRLAVLLIAGTVPGVIAGSVIRVELLPGAHVFDLMVAAVLIPLGISIALIRPGTGPQPDAPPRPVRTIPVAVLIVLAVAVGCVGGIYGIGGGHSCPGSGRLREKGRRGGPRGSGLHLRDLGGWRHHLHCRGHPCARPRGPDWPTGIALGVGRLAGAYTGARIQPRLPELLIRRVMAPWSLPSEAMLLGRG